MPRRGPAGPSPALADPSLDAAVLAALHEAARAPACVLTLDLPRPTDGEQP